MKKIMIYLLSLFLLTGCTTSITESNKLSIVTTIFPQFDFVREIARDNVEITMLLSPGEESHSYEPTPQDIKAIQNCDLFIYVGGENDVWVENILDSLDTIPDTLKLVDCVDTVNEESVEGMFERSEDEEAIDEHVWTSPTNAIKIVEKITELLTSKDIDNKDIYIENSNNYISELEELYNAFKEVIDNGVRNTIVFGDRFPFRYLADEYGLEYYAAFPGCSSENEPSAATIAYLINKVKDEDIPVVFTIELSNQNIANAIAEATNAQVLTFYSCHNVTKDQFNEGVSYLDMMWENVESLKTALY
ncbi:MAG: metal ABC transporter substrate-binding protein [Erysipelotrichaceae bacterium]|nr:metal ABC transporter substrate-binding protein [Erysipelotrichaceae bacterium]